MVGLDAGEMDVETLELETEALELGLELELETEALELETEVLELETEALELETEVLELELDALVELGNVGAWQGKSLRRKGLRPQMTRTRMAAPAPLHTFMGVVKGDLVRPRPLRPLPSDIDHYHYITDHFDPDPFPTSTTTSDALRPLPLPSDINHYITDHFGHFDSNPFPPPPLWTHFRPLPSDIDIDHSTTTLDALRPPPTSTITITLPDIDHSTTTLDALRPLPSDIDHYHYITQPPLWTPSSFIIHFDSL
ncbi:hypothetical protein C8R44DRAFT_867503 [Mycena epipterygia]|nr:hypothetical protein C8R44DRAFT_867503 [Mycena epipterygia]